MVNVGDINVQVSQNHLLKAAALGVYAYDKFPTFARKFTRTQSLVILDPQIPARACCLLILQNNNTNPKPERSTTKS